MELILDTTDVSSLEFTTTSDIFWVVISRHAGGTWNSEMQDPDGTWIIVNDSDFSGNGAWAIPGVPGGRFRFSGGTLGAKIWVTGGGVFVG